MRKFQISNFKYQISNKKINSTIVGFTLIELLVVISIIGILAAFILSNFIGVKQRARDAQRKSDLRQLQTAIELYRNDQGSYPAAASLTACGGALTSGTTTYIQKIPCDPLSTGSSYNGGVYYYLPANGNTTYTLTACLENPNDTSTGTTSTNPGGTGNCTNGIFFQVANP